MSTPRTPAVRQTRAERRESSYSSNCRAKIDFADAGKPWTICPIWANIQRRVAGLGQTGPLAQAQRNGAVRDPANSTSDGTAGRLQSIGSIEFSRRRALYRSLCQEPFWCQRGDAGIRPVPRAA